MISPPSFFKAIQEDEDTSERFKDLLSAYEQYKAGDRKIMHNVGEKALHLPPR